MHVDVEMLVNQMIPKSLQLKILRNPEMEVEHRCVRERLIDSSLETMRQFYCSGGNNDVVDEKEKRVESNFGQADRFKEVFERRNFERLETRPQMIERADQLLNEQACDTIEFRSLFMELLT